MDRRLREASARIRERELSLVFERVRAHLGHGVLRVLELGAGTGDNARLLRALGPVTAVEPFAAFDEQPGVTLVRAAAEALPLPDASFELVFSTSVLEHVGDLRRALAETSRVLAPGGLEVHVVPCVEWKVLAMAGHWVAQGRAALRRLSGRRRASTGAASAGGWRGDTSAAPERRGSHDARDVSARATVRRGLARLVPSVHGTSPDNLSELASFRRATWRRVFADAGRAILEEQPLLLYSPPDLPLVPPVDARRLGLASCTAFYLRPARRA